MNIVTEVKQEKAYDLKTCCKDWLKSSNEMRKNYKELVAIIGKEG